MIRCGRARSAAEQLAGGKQLRWSANRSELLVLGEGSGLKQGLGRGWAGGAGGGGGGG